MKVVIIILILIVLGFVVAIGVAVYRATTPPAPPSAHGPPTTSDGEIDEDALADWKPPPMAALMGRLTKPFAPKVFKKAVEVTLQPDPDQGGGKSDTVPVPAAKKDMRVARLRLLEGRGAVAIYTSAFPGEGETSPQRVCLCPENTILEADEAEVCEEAWRKARATSDGRLLCRAKDDDVSAVVYRSGGVIEVTSIGKQPVRVTIR